MDFVPQTALSYLTCCKETKLLVNAVAPQLSRYTNHALETKEHL